MKYLEQCLEHSKHYFRVAIIFNVTYLVFLLKKNTYLEDSMLAQTHTREMHRKPGF